MADNRTLHVVPINDLIEHDDISDECVCGPRTEIVQPEGKPDGWVIVHNSLDGREKDE